MKGKHGLLHSLVPTTTIVAAVEPGFCFLLLSTLVCNQPTELILGLFCVNNFPNLLDPPPPPQEQEVESALISGTERDEMMSRLFEILQNAGYRGVPSDVIVNNFG